MQRDPDCLKQAARYYQVMRNMPLADREAFLSVYHLAPHGQFAGKNAVKGEHVRLAMIESLRHPGLAYWVRVNLAVRVARKLAQTTGRHEQARKLGFLLESFHVAADAFALELSLPVALARRQEKAGQTASGTGWIPQNVPGVSAEEVALIQSFKNRVIPGLVHRIRGEHTRTA